MKRVLVAGVGNVFLGDDGFGVEVARRLAGEALPDGVEVVDIGIRGLHLAYQLLEGYDLLIAIDAVARGGPPGTLYLLEPDANAGAEGAAPRPEANAPEAHGIGLGQVFAMVRALGGTLGRVLVVGCEPARVEESMGLSEVVQSAVGPAVQRVRQLAWQAIEPARAEGGIHDEAQE
jgi:hydrogenase maturation protease